MWGELVMHMMEIKKVNKYYNVNRKEKFHVLKDINMSFNAGEFIAIIGESGSGKSTLMNLIGGLDSDYSGNIIFKGDNISSYKGKQLDIYRKNKIGFIFQSFNLIPHLSVLDNVIMPMTINGISKSERVERGRQILKKLGLYDQIHKKPDSLSGGQKQRVSIARALINNPDIIIADEPTGSLDSENTEKILAIINEIVKEGKLVVMVTHSERVASCAGRIIEIKDGQIIKDIKNEDCIENLAAVDIDEENQNNALSNNKKHRNRKKKNRNLGIFSAMKLALINMKEKILRNILISVGGSIGIMGVILMLGFGNGIQTYFNNTMDSYVNPKVIEVNIPEDDEEINENDNALEIPKNINSGKSFTEEDLEQLSFIDNVIEVEKGYNMISMGVNSLSYNNKNCNLLRLATVSSSILESSISEGRMPQDGEILINKSVAEKLGGDIVGETVKLNLLIGDSKVKTDFVVSGIYSASYSDFNSMIRCVFVKYSDLEKIYRDNNKNLNPNTAYITGNDEKNTEFIKNRAEELGYVSSSQEQMTKLFNQMINIVTYVLSGVAFISLVVSSIMILVVLYMSVVERVKEIGILRSIGARKKDIRRIFVNEAFLIGLFSGLLGSVFSVCAMIFINRLSAKMFSINLVLIDTKYIIFGIGLCIIMSMAAGTMPALKASRLDPITSLRRE